MNVHTQRTHKSKFHKNHQEYVFGWEFTQEASFVRFSEVPPAILPIPKSEEIVWMQDDAPLHWAISVRAYFQEVGPTGILCLYVRCMILYRVWLHVVRLQCKF